MDIFLIVGIMAMCILAGEIALWASFQHKITGISLPHEHDASLLGFFTLLRLRLVAILHAVITVTFCCTLLLLLW